jgi:TetR/AcrR family transcriptional regulator
VGLQRPPLKLIAERGVDAVSTQLIADRIGFTQAAVFRQFSTKKALWSAVMDWLEEQLIRVRQTARTEATDEGFGVLQRMFFGHVALIERHPGLAKAIMSDHIRRQYSELHERFAVAHKEYASDIRKALNVAAKSGQISPRFDRGAATTLFLCAIQGLGFQFSIARVLPSITGDAVRIFRLYEQSLGYRQE